ncbi:MAG: TerB family tellurite resistance protein [Cyanobacteriota bacterium]|nr:TerB family tellurite resistance protein [Cyanobacteriota bacterium]
MDAPLPPSITPHQMNLLRAVTAMAWSDGVLEPAEIDVMAAQLSHHFARDPQQQGQLARQIQDYFLQHVPLSEVLPKLTETADKRLVLKLGYLVIAASARTPDEPIVNMDEQVAFTELVKALGLPNDIVEAVAQEAEAELGDTSVAPMEALISGFTHHFQP